LRADRTCYKELWYPPVQSPRCLEMTPYTGCNCHCLYCWRVHLGDRPHLRWKEPSDLGEFDEPDKIVHEAIERRREMLSGFKGNPKVDRKKFEAALNPTMMTMSLTGEPTLYPKISQLVVEARNRGMITFLVTNGTKHEAIEKMDPLPYQLYVSVSAPNKRKYVDLVKPLMKDAWEMLNSTLELLPSLDTRKVIRLTMVKGWNMTNHEEYAKLVRKAEPNFIEIKAYEWVGESQKRLPRKSMPFMEEIEEFAEEISKLSGYEIRGKYQPSGAFLLA